MTQHYTEVVIVCEDRQQEVFARHFLTTYFGNRLHPTRIRPVFPGRGDGSGEQFVREQYAKEVKTYRSKRNQMNIALVVMIDADTGTVENRQQQLDDVLSDKGIETRQQDEQIAIFVPKRNIETWIYHLRGARVDEETTYQHLAKERACKPDVQTLAEDCRNHKALTDDAPASLKVACTELERLTT